MTEKYKLPKKSDIKVAMINFLSTIESATTGEINQYKINFFNIPKKQYTAVNDYENTTIFAYRMCWIRTELRNDGIIESPQKDMANS